MKHMNIILAGAIILLMTAPAFGMGQASKTKTEQGKGKGVKIISVRHKYIKFVDAEGKSIKTINVESSKKVFSREKEKIVYKVRTFNNISLSADSGYIALLYTDYKTVSTPEGSEPYDAMQRIDYYNKNGKRLWTSDSVASCAISPKGDVVILYKQILSKQTNQYDDPEGNDPEHREKLCVVDSMGIKLYEYEVNHFQSFSYIRNNPRYIAFTSIPSFGIMNPSDGFIDIQRKKKYIIPGQYKSRHTYRISEDGNIYFESWDAPGTVDKIVKPEEWQ